jgi:hypothetical protein
MSQPRSPADEIARRGEALYERELRAKIEPGNEGKILVINIDTGEYELDDDHLAAVRRLRARDGDAELYALRRG